MILSSFYSIAELPCLQKINIEDNRLLTNIPRSVFFISKLESVLTAGCSSLNSPPTEVCSAGVQAVRKYMEKGNKQRFIPVTVLGKSGAGKTSLVDSLKENRQNINRSHALWRSIWRRD